MRDFARDLAADLLPVLLPILAGIVAEFLRRLLRVQQDSEAGRAINLAVERAAARVYQNAVAEGLALSSSGTMARLTAQATTDATRRVSGAMNRRGVSHADFAAMVQGEFGRLIAADPTIPGPRPGPTTKE